MFFPILELTCIFFNSDHKKFNFQFSVSFLPTNTVILTYLGSTFSWGRSFPVYDDCCCTSFDRVTVGNGALMHRSQGFILDTEFI